MALEEQTLQRVTARSNGKEPPSILRGEKALTWLAEQGAMFALPYGRTKDAFPTGWQKNPHTLEEALAHSRNGGNVGILGGKYSNNIVPLDRDLKFAETCVLLGKFALTAKIKRSNAPDRGKLLYRINGKIPQSTNWRPKGKKHPYLELLGDNGQKHAVCPPSRYKGEHDTEEGEYILEDTHYGILEITPDELDFIWRIIAGESVFKDVKTEEQKQQKREEKDQYVKRVKEYWTVPAIFDHFRLTTDGVISERGEWRALGNGGLLFQEDKFFEFSAYLGGDCIDAWQYGKTGEKAPRKDPKAFMQLIDEMAEAAGISKPETSSIEGKGKVTLWLQTLDSLGYTIRLNRLEDIVEVNGEPLTDIERSKIVLEMLDRGIPQSYVEHCLNVVAARDSYHPIQDYLNGLEWDGDDHLTRLMEHLTGDGTMVIYADGKQLPIHYAIFRSWLLGCVARALDGDKQEAFKHQNEMLVPVGEQNIGKSGLIRWLTSGVGFAYHRESFLDPHAQDHIRSCVAKWIWEIAELGSSLRRSDRDAIKGLITQEWHTYRKPWGKGNITKPTLCSFVGTVNPETGFLDDPTGHRRFLPVNLQAIDKTYAEKIDVNQLWAQLVSMYKSGVLPGLSPEEKLIVHGSYEEHEIENPLQTYIQMYFNIDPGNEKMKCFTATIIARLKAFGVTLNQNTKAAGREINDALAPMGLTRKPISIENMKGKGWVGIEPTTRKAPGTRLAN